MQKKLQKITLQGARLEQAGTPAAFCHGDAKRDMYGYAKIIYDNIHLRRVRLNNENEGLPERGEGR